MTNVGEAYVEVRADTSRVAGDIEKGVTQSLRGAEKAATKFGDSTQGGFKKASMAVEGFTKRAALPASLALATMTGIMLKSTSAAEEVIVANKRLSTILKSMGYPEAEKRVMDYAAALEEQIAVDAEVVKATQAKLATFANLTSTINEAGGAFDRATIAAFDLAAAGFGSAESNAVQLGKALQDPIKGVAALARSGVTFTAQEKQKIKTLVESNRMLEAQDLVLKAIEKQVGGTAAATATDSARMKIAFDNVMESVGMALLPVLEQLTKVLQSVAGWVQDNRGVFLAFVGVITVVSAGILAVNFAFKAYNAVALVTKGLNAMLKTSFSTLQVSMGAVGLVLAAAATIYSIVGNKKKDYTAQTEALTQALNQEGDAQIDAVANLVANDKAMKNLIEVSKKYGFSLKDIRDAINKGGPVYKRLSAALLDNVQKTGFLKNSNLEAINVLSESRNNVQKLADAYNLLGKKTDWAAKIQEWYNKAVGNLQAYIDAGKAARGLGSTVSAVQERIKTFTDSFKTVKDAAKASLAKAKDEFNNFASSVSSSIRNAFSLSEAYEQRGTGTFLESLNKQAKAVKDFSVLLNRLIAGGASEEVVQQVLGAGVEAGTAIANELLNTTGGIDTANKLAAEVGGIADTVGKNAAGSFRQAGIDTANALIAGIDSVVKTYQLKLKTKGLTDKQVKKLQKNFEAEISIRFQAGGTEVPQLANGAYVASPQLAMIGEAGPEAVIPISRPQRAMDLLETTGLAELVRRSSMPTSAVQIGNATFVQPVDVELLAQKVVAAERSRVLSR